jgi:RNA polymerase sigma factor (TIGR02999 family)
MSSPGQFTRLLFELREGDEGARSELIALVYGELHRLAARYMRRERPDHTLQATALVHEAYLQLSQQQDANWQNRAHFLAVAATTMRSILIDYARAHRADKRGGGEPKLSLEESLVFAKGRSADLLALDEALEKLAAFAPREGRVVELRYFGGLSVEEVAEVLQISPKTVNRDWRRAKDWLHGQIRGDQK